MTGANQQPIVTLIDSSEDRRWTVPLTPAGLTIGRLTSNDVVLEDRAVSRRHLRLDWDGEIATVTDLGSTFGTSIDTGVLEPHTATAWGAEQDLCVGRYTLQIHLPQAAPRDTSIRSAIRVFAEPINLSIVPGTPSTVRLTVANFDHRVDHLNIRVDGVPDGWLELSTPSVRLNPGAHETLTINVLVRPEKRAEPGEYDVTAHVWSDAIASNRTSLSMQWTLNASAVTEPPVTPTAQTQDRPPLSVNPQAFAVTPGTPTTIAVFIENQDSAADEFELSFAGIPRAWVTLPSAPLRIDAQGSTTAMIQIYVPKVPASLARSYPITATSRSRRTGRTRSATAQCTVAAFIDIALGIRPQVRSGRLKGRYQIALENRGNDDASITLSGSAADGRLAFRFSEPSVGLKPGAAASVLLDVRARNRWHSQEVSHPFQVHSRVENVEISQASAEYRQRPAVLAWTLHRVWAGTSLILALLLRVVLVLGFLLLVAVVVALIVEQVWNIDVQREVTNYLTSFTVSFETSMA